MNLRWRLIENIGVLYTINGEEKTAMLNFAFLAFIGDLENEIEFLVMPYDGQTAMGVRGGVEDGDIIVIKKIYDAGHSDTFYEENGFAVYLNNSKWCLINTPEGEYTIPTTVGGQHVDEVWVDYIKGTPTFDRSVRLGDFGGSGWEVSTVVLTTPDVSFFMGDGVLPWRGLTVVDLSACGDNITIPEEVLNKEYGYSSVEVIYVNETVKAKYADYDFIQVKPTE